jgi:hypothetical protein
MTKFSIRLGQNTFDAEGETLAVDEHFVSLFRVWVNAQGLGDAVTTEELAQRLEAQNQRLQDAVDAVPTAGAPPAPILLGETKG